MLVPSQGVLQDPRPAGHAPSVAGMGRMGGPFGIGCDCFFFLSRHPGEFRIYEVVYEVVGYTLR